MQTQMDAEIARANKESEEEIKKIVAQLKREKITVIQSQIEEIKTQLEKLKAAVKSKEAAKEVAAETAAATEVQKEAVAVKPEIQYDDFAKLDFRVGTIISAEKVAKADKLLQLQVDLGFEIRTIVSGIAMHFKPEEIVGKQVTVVANLAPRKMRGIESNGMILMAEDAAGKLHFINPEITIDNGASVS